MSGDVGLIHRDQGDVRRPVGIEDADRSQRMFSQSVIQGLVDSLQADKLARKVRSVERIAEHRSE